MGTVLQINRLCCLPRVTVSWHPVPTQIGCNIERSHIYFLGSAVFSTCSSQLGEKLQVMMLCQIGVQQSAPHDSLKETRKPYREAPLSLRNSHLIDKFICD